MSWQYRVIRTAFAIVGLSLVSYALGDYFDTSQTVALYAGGFMIYLVIKDDA